MTRRITSLILSRVDRGEVPEEHVKRECSHRAESIPQQLPPTSHSKSSWQSWLGGETQWHACAEYLLNICMSSISAMALILRRLSELHKSCLAELAAG